MPLGLCLLLLVSLSLCPSLPHPQLPLSLCPPWAVSLSVSLLPAPSPLSQQEEACEGLRFASLPTLFPPQVFFSSHSLFKADKVRTAAPS